MSYKHYIYILINFIWWTLQAQNPQYTIIDKSTGLPSNSVYSILQDNKGYMWFATDKGLVKYDGYEFKTYLNKNQSSKSGTNIKEDRFGRIWYQNFDGNLFFVENDSLHSLELSESIGYFNYGIIQNNLFVIQKQGVAVYSLKTLSLIKNIKLNSADFIYSYSNNNCFYITSGKNTIYEIDNQLVLKTIEFNFYNSNNPSSHIFASQNLCFLYSKEAGTNNSIYKLQNNKFEALFKTENFLVQNISYVDNSIWFCSPHGVYAYNINNSKQNYTSYFKDYSISCVLKDREGGYWFSTINNGILYVKDLGSLFYPLNHIPLKLFIKDKKVFFSNTNAELIEFNSSTKTFTPLFKSKNNSILSFCYYDSIYGNIITSNSYIETISKNGGLKTEHGALKDMELVDSNYYAYAATGACMLYCINKNKKDAWSDFYHLNYIKEKNTAQFVTGCRAKSVKYIPENKTIYFATSHGLQMVTPNIIRELKQNNLSLFCSKLCKYKNTIYALTTNNEILKINGTTVTPIMFNNTDVDKKIDYVKIIGNVLYVATTEGLYSVNLSDTNLKLNQIQKINYEVNDIELLNNELIILYKEGILFKPINNINNMPDKPLFEINYINVNGKKTNEHIFHYTENNISINYSILSFRTDNYFPLLYRINNGPWQNIGSQTRQLNLAAMAPGDYTVTFKFKNKTDILKNISFKINKPFWLKWWFMSFVIIVLLFITYLFFKWRIVELEQKNNLLNQKIETEQKYYKSTLKAIKAQMNPHFFYNALNTIQSFIYNDDKRNAATYLSKFSKLTRMILEMSEKDTISLSDEINALHLYLDIEKARFNDDLTFEIKYAESIYINNTYIPPMLIQPYVENAVKHGLLHKKGNKILVIEFEKRDNNLIVTIDDNGIGRKISQELNEKKSSKHVSFSTIANKQRLDILNKDQKENGVSIVDKNNPNGTSAGTKVVLTIPFSNQN